MLASLSSITSILLCDCETWTLLADSEERMQAFEAKCLRKLRCISYLEHRTNDFFVGPQNLFWQLLRDGNLHGSGMSHTAAASPESCFRASWRMGDAVVSREMLDGQHQRVDMSAHARIAHKGLL